MNLHTDNVFIETVSSILSNAGLISHDETLMLIPSHFITIGGNPSSHYKIICGNKKFFLKSVKDNDNTVFCLPYLHTLNCKYGVGRFPELLSQTFSYKDRDFYILEYLEGETFEELDGIFSEEEWRIVAMKLKERIHELYSCTSDKYSDRAKFYSESFGELLSNKLTNRLKNSLFAQFSTNKLATATATFNRILSNVTFPKAHLIHMDVKPANIIYNRNEKKVSLIDFENARFCDYDFGRTQLLLTAYKGYSETYTKYVLPYLTDGFTIESAVKDDKCLSYLYYQTLCNLIFYESRHLPCPTAMSDLFNKLLNILAKGYYK